MMDNISVSDLIEHCQTDLSIDSVEENEGLENTIEVTDINRPGLALAGYFDTFSAERVQLLGKTELSYIAGQASEHLREMFSRMTANYIPCFVVCRGLSVPAELSHACAERNIPIITSNIRTSETAAIISDHLRDVLTQEVSFHGDLVDVSGIGVLILGRSGIGKSECALDLVSRGHRLVADDVVHVKKKLGKVLMGRSSERLRNHIEIQGIGILNVSKLYGIHAVRLQKRVEMIVRIEDLNSKRDYERTGLTEEYMNILGVQVPYILIPVTSGKSISHLIEVAALNQLLKLSGYDSAKEFNRSLIESMSEASELLQDSMQMDTE